MGAVWARRTDGIRRSRLCAGESTWVRLAQITEDSFTELSVKSRNIIRINRFLSAKRTILQSSCYIIYSIFPGRSQRPCGGDWKSPGKCGKIAENKRGKGMCDAYTGFIRFPWVRGPYGAVRGAGAAPGDPASGGLRAGRSAAGGAVSGYPAAGSARQLRLWRPGPAGAADGAGRRPHPDDARPHPPCEVRPHGGHVRPPGSAGRTSCCSATPTSRWWTAAAISG